jgi:DNA-binding transcriptional MerR regulator
MRIRTREREKEIRPLLISAAAAAAGVSAMTLKNYEKAGLFIPARDNADRRLYTPDDIEMLKRIRDERAERASRKKK